MIFFQVDTRQLVREELLTKPRPVFGISMDEISTTGARVQWLVHEGQTCLRGYNIEVSNSFSK